MDIYMLDGSREPTEEEWRIASNGPSIVRSILGSDARQMRVLGGTVHWGRVIFARVDGAIAGYILFFLRGAGPHSAPWRVARTEYGVFSGSVRWLLLRGLCHRYERLEACAYKMVVRPAFRRQGVGRALMAFWLDTLRAEGVTSANLEAWAGNERAIAFYRDQGFTVWSTKRVPFIPEQHGDNRLVWMTQRL